MKYELKECVREVKYKERKEIVKGCTVDQEDYESTLIKSFDSKEDALEELKKYKSSIHEFSSNIGRCYEVTEYFVEEVEYDEDDEWIAGGDIWEFSEMHIELVAENSTADTLGVFDNFADAENALNECEVDAHISF